MDLPDRKFSTDDWSHMFQEMCKHWTKWDPPESTIDAYWSALSQHTAQAVRMAHRDVVTRYSSNGLPQIKWYEDALKKHRAPVSDDGYDVVRVMVPASRSEIVDELRSQDRTRVLGWAVGHYLQRASVRDTNQGGVSESPENWSDELLHRVWCSLREAREEPVPSREARRQRPSRQISDVDAWPAHEGGGQPKRIVSMAQVSRPSRPASTPAPGLSRLRSVPLESLVGVDLRHDRAGV